MANRRGGTKRGRVEVHVVVGNGGRFVASVTPYNQFQHDWNFCKCACCEERFEQWRREMQAIRRRLLESDDDE